MPTPRGPRLRFNATARGWIVCLLLAAAAACGLARLRPLRVAAQDDAPLPPLLISEIHVDPLAVDDSVGEWIEVVNRGTQPVDLQQWTLADDDGDRHTIAFSLPIAPGDYRVLAVNGDPATNGGVRADYVVQTLRLGNAYGLLQLIAPDGEAVDVVAWGRESPLVVEAGASLERVAAHPAAAWAIGHSRWPGSAGDRGSPGTGYVPPPTPTATTTITPEPTPTATLTPPPAIPPRLLISEVMIDPAAVTDEAGEWIELLNLHDAALNLRDWALADDDRDWAVLDGDVWLAPGAYAVLARTGAPALNGGIAPLALYAGLQLANDGDELRLIAPWGVEVDRVVWGDGGLSAPRGASLERVAFDGPPQWAAAFWQWPGCAGDRGSPGTGYVPPPTPTATASPTELPAPTATLTPPPAVPPRVLISEVMIDPAAVADEAGEWLEVVNLHAESINLRGWMLADDDRDRTVLDADVWLAPGAYAVLARNGDPATNGGVIAQGVYAGLQLANNGDELRLIAPWGVEVDRVVWGDGLRAPSGASLERVALDGPPQWAVAAWRWPGSAGDRGSPGTGYVPPPPPTLAPTPSPSPTALPTATPLPAHWPRADVPSPLQIDQVIVAGSDGEVVVLVNVGAAPLALDGWLLGDAEFPGDDEGVVALPAGTWLAPGERYIIAANASAFLARWGYPPHAEWSESDPNVPTLPRITHLGARPLALADGGDEVIVVDPAGRVADVVAYGNGAYDALGVQGRLPAPGERALRRAPGVAWPVVTDVRHRFLLGHPDPAAGYALPAAAPRPALALEDGLVAAWGSLGAVSGFSAAGVAPPHVVAAAAAAQGLDFIAVADDARMPTDWPMPVVWPIVLPAWGWSGPDGLRLPVYSESTTGSATVGGLFDFLVQVNGLAQAPAAMGLASPHTPLYAADKVYAPGGLRPLTAAWRATGQALLPAGNSTPPVDGSAPNQMRYSGLAVTAHERTAILAALAAGRGWLTSSPDLWLTLRSADGDWMGSRVAAGNAVTLRIAAGHRGGLPVAVALWQDDRLLRQLETPMGGAPWEVTVPVPPGMFVYAVATLASGDFAVTAPLYSPPSPGGRGLINEVLPRPASDHNGDGQVNTDDEFVELINPGAAPLALAGWQLQDAGGRTFTLGPDRFVTAGGLLLLWRREFGLSLNDDGDSLRLLMPDGQVADEVVWQPRQAGHALGRLPDGGAHRDGLLPTPGQPNQALPPPPPRTDPPRVDPLDVADPANPNFGQATGPPGSLAVAKLRGLYAPVEFRGQVTVPPGLFNSVIYVAEAAPPDAAPPALAGLGVQVYLAANDFMPLQEGDWVMVKGTVTTFRGELEIRISEPGQAWPIGPGTPLLPLAVAIAEVGEALEGRLVTVEGCVTGWQGDSIYLGDPADQAAAPVRVTVRSSLDWKRPFVQVGERYRATGIVSQFAQESPWNGGYRLLVRFRDDLVKLAAR